jgi:hypothetical protein
MPSSVVCGGRSAALALLAALVVVWSGCSGSLGAKVSGTVTLDDKPLTSGDVAFVPSGATGTIGYGKIDTQGNYTISTATTEGLVPGSYTATVVATEAIPESTGNVEVTPKVLTPAKYSEATTSDLKFDVKGGNNDIPLKLNSK